MKSAKNIAYKKGSEKDPGDPRHRLDVYYPDNTGAAKDVMVFIHGGSWSQGHKGMYKRLGEILAEKGIVCAIINYRLAPEVMFSEMALDCASAVKWVYDTIVHYGGDRERIFLMGHSAGGHLCALITLNNEFFAKLKFDNPVKGCILNDAFGLNIHTLLHEHQTPYNYLLHKVFTDDPNEWERGSPSNFIDGSRVPFLVLAGERTYPFIMLDNGMFAEKMEKAGRQLQWDVIKGKSHYQMIAQMDDPDNPVYSSILDFMKSAEE
jgi:acetyl esterase/lipase